MLSQKALFVISCLLSVVALLVITNSGALAGDHPLPLNLEGSPPAILGEKAISPSGFDYFLVEEWDGQRLWSDKGGDWALEISNPLDFRGIWGLDGQDIFIAGHSFGGGGIFSYHNGVWGPEDFSGMVFDIWGFDRNDVFAVGQENNTTNLYHYDGNIWELAASNSLLLAGRELWGPSAGNLYMVGSGGSIGYFDGENLTPMISGVTTNLEGIWGTGTHNIYAVGQAGVILHYDGNSWQREEIPVTEGNYKGVWGSGPNDIYVVGSLDVLHFDGSTWSQMVGMPAGVAVNDVFGSSSTDVVFVGDNGLIVRFDGETLIDESITGQGEGNFFSIWGGLRQEGDQHWSSAFADTSDGGQGLDSSVYGLQFWDGGIALSGDFLTAGTDSITRLAHWAGNAMSPLYQTEGPNDLVFDLAIYDGELIAGGRFTSIDGLDINCVAAWNGTQWRQLGAGVGAPTGNGVVRFTIWDGKLVAVGEPQCTAAWDGNSWSPMGGFSGLLIAAIEYQGDLLVGGQISEPGNAMLRLGDSGWDVYPGSQIDGGNVIYDFEIFNNDLLVGGIFQTFGELSSGDNLVRLSNSNWSVFAEGVGGNVYHIGSYQNGVVVSGFFSNVGSGLPAKNVAFYGDLRWHALGSGFNNWAWSSLVDGDLLTMAGSFTAAGNHPGFRVASWEKVDLAIPDAPSSGPADAGQDHTISINIEGDPGSFPVNLHYRLRDEDTYQVAVMTESVAKTGTFEATVPGDFLGDLGFQYFVSSGSSSNPVFFPASAPAEPAFTSVVMVDEALDIPVANQYVMMGIPFIPDLSIGEIMVNTFGAYDPSKWRFGRWNPLNSTYGEFPNIAAHAPGRGYWLIHKNSAQVTATGVSTSTVGSVVVTMEPGWNQIATPYNFEIPWSAVTLGPNIGTDLVARAGGGYVHNVPLMNPWQGYWVINSGLNSSTLTIPPTVFTKKEVGSELKEPKQDSTLWAITLGVEYEDRFDRQNIAAISPEGAAGIDALDSFEPPALPGDVSLFFEIYENEKTHALRRDMRAPFTEGVAWDLVLRRLGGGLMELEISGIADVPAEHGVYLLTQDGRMDLRQSEQVVLRVPSGGETRLRLVVGEPGFVQEQELSLPRPFALRLAYPNPFNPKTTLGFTLPRTSHVSLDIFDVRGRLVRNLVDDDFEAGLHEVPWNGLDNGGRGVSAGVYFSRMQTDEFQQTGKMTLVR